MSEMEKTALLYSDEDDENLLDLEKGRSQNKPDNKIGRIQNQVNEVIDDMRINIEKVVDRGANLNNLNDRSEQLSVSGDLFSKRAKNMRKSMWLRTCRARLYLGIAVGSVFILIIFVFYRAFKN